VGRHLLISSEVAFYRKILVSPCSRMIWPLPNFGIK
jgi:hypothetical protein